MKTIIAVVLVLFSSFSFGASYDMKDPTELVGDRCAPGDILFYGMNMKDTKDVLICQWGQKVFYSYGSTMVGGNEKEMMIDLDASKVLFRISDSDVVSGETMVIRNATHAYGIEHKVDLKTGDETNTLVVIQLSDKKVLATIKLDPDFIVNNFRNNFVQ